MTNAEMAVRATHSLSECAEGNMTVEEQEREAPEDVVDTKPEEDDVDASDDVDDDKSEKGEPEEKMISQAELDRILQKRLKRQEDQLLKRFGDYDSLKEDAAKFRALEDEKKTDAERWEKEKTQLMASLQEHQEKLTKLERANLISDLATDKGLPKSFWKRVSGETEEEIADDIDSMINDLNLGKKDDEEPKAGSKDKTPKQPPKKLQGGGGENQDPEPDVDKIVAGIPRGPQVRTR